MFKSVPDYNSFTDADSHCLLDRPAIRTDIFTSVNEFHSVTTALIEP